MYREMDKQYTLLALLALLMKLKTSEAWDTVTDQQETKEK